MNLCSLKKIPNLNDLKITVDNLIDVLPIKIKNSLKGINFLMDNYPDQFDLNDLQIDDKYDLLSLYKKNTNKKTNIFFYRCPIIRYSLDTNQDFIAVLKNILLCKFSKHI